MTSRELEYWLAHHGLSEVDIRPSGSVTAVVVRSARWGNYMVFDLPDLNTMMMDAGTLAKEIADEMHSVGMANAMRGHNS